MSWSTRPASYGIEMGCQTPGAKLAWRLFDTAIEEGRFSEYFEVTLLWRALNWYFKRKGKRLYASFLRNSCDLPAFKLLVNYWKSKT